jgi:hypothetical protein
VSQLELHAQKDYFSEEGVLCLVSQTKKTNAVATKRKAVD